MQNGSIVRGSPIVPAIKRSLGKLGRNAQAGGRTAAELAMVDAMRLFAIGAMFAGRIPSIAAIFINCARNHVCRVNDLLGPVTYSEGGSSSSTEFNSVVLPMFRKKVYLDEYSAVGKTFGAGAHSLATVMCNADPGYGEAPDQQSQLASLANLFEMTVIDSASFAKLEILAQDCKNASGGVRDNRACYLQLPTALQGADNSK